MPQAKEQSEKPKKRAPRKRAAKTVKKVEVPTAVPAQKVPSREPETLLQPQISAIPRSAEKVSPVQIQKPIKSKRKRLFVYGISTILVVIFAGALWYQFMYSSPEAAARRADKEAERTIAEVGTLILLPTAETPVIYDINDPVLLIRQQPFFTGAEKGDKLLIYSKEEKAVLYSPRRHIIVNVGGIVSDTITAPGLEEVSTEEATTTDNRSE